MSASFWRFFSPLGDVILGGTTIIETVANLAVADPTVAVVTPILAISTIAAVRIADDLAAGAPAYFFLVRSTPFR